ncbi:hypothetical protein PHJA_002550000 [Phtheirospermum japonicum]|uniref:C2 domain-containing protein n=1 Tax=Phtheirospermum japonicum TaxID=374723 RepID=A0A830CVZ5_9LAMI|nr:hypothetical protein PHJA_002550000 [Phtheirospermum japonicum]
MEYRPLHITLISADGLKDVKLFSKMDVYAEVSIAGYPQSKKKTRVDKNCGTNPKWSDKDDAHMEFMVDEPYLTKPGLSLLFQLKAEASIGSDKVVGSATVPVHDLFHPDAAQDKVVEFQLHRPSGKPKGSVKFSYRFAEKFTHQVAAAKNHAPDPVTAYPAATPPYAAGGASAYPPPAGYPQAGYGAYPPQTSGYGYQGPPQAGYGYQGPPPPGYGYAPYGQQQKPKKNKMGGMGAGLGLGLGAGLLGGMLVGEMAGDAAAYADGYDDAMGGGDFDF